ATAPPPSTGSSPCGHAPTAASASPGWTAAPPPAARRRTARAMRTAMAGAADPWPCAAPRSTPPCASSPRSKWTPASATAARPPPRSPRAARCWSIAPAAKAKCATSTPPASAMAAGPVSGRAVAAAGGAAVVAWYTEAAAVPAVRAAASVDAGDRFEAPVVIDAGAPVLGRVDVALADGQAWVLWLREEGEGQSLWLSRRSPDLATEHQRLQVATLAGRGRGTGFPRMAVAGGVAHVVWTDVADGMPGLRGARVLPRAAGG